MALLDIAASLVAAIHYKPADKKLDAILDSLDDIHYQLMLMDRDVKNSIN